MNSPGAGTPTGSVQFQDNGTDLGSPQSLGGGGQASIATSSLSVGSHTISVAFTSDSANFNGSAGTTTPDRQEGPNDVELRRRRQAQTSTIPLSSPRRLTRTDSASPVAAQTVTLDDGLRELLRGHRRERRGGMHDHAERACRRAPGHRRLHRRRATTSPAATARSFTVTREETSTTYTGPTVDRTGQPGHARRATARGRRHTDRRTNADPHHRHRRRQPAVRHRADRCAPGTRSARSRASRSRKAPSL